MSFAAAVISSVLAATPVYEGTGSATLPLSELIPLVKDYSEKPPPVGAVVSGARLEGRISGRTLEVTAHLTVDVLEGGWQRVALFKLTPGVAPLEAPAVSGGTVGMHQGELCFFSQANGRHAFEVKLTVAGEGGDALTARLGAGADLPPVVLELAADARADAPARVSAVGGAWDVKWKARAEPPPKKLPPPPPLEPRVASASARFVTTLEGKGELTVSYALQLDRVQSFGVTVPAGYGLQRVRVNGVQVPLPSGAEFALEVSPARAGETSGSVELQLTRALGVFHLSGRVDLSLPAVSWPVAELRASAFLPQVFTWKRAGGSLEPMELDATPAGSGLPGRQLGFRQFLVSGSAPTLELEYAVDLEGKYFRAGG